MIFILLLFIKKDSENGIKKNYPRNIEKMPK